MSTNPHLGHADRTSALRRLENEARERGSAGSRAGIDVRAARCELCGGGEVRWGSMCEACRARLSGAPSPRTGHELLALPGERFLESIPATFYRASAEPNREVHFVSPQIADLCGHPAGDFANRARNLIDIVHADDRADVVKSLSTRVPGGEVEIQYRVVHANGSQRWAHDRARVSVTPTATWLDGVIVDITNRQREQEQLAHQALHDPLTDLPNRRALDDRMLTELERVQRNGGALSIVVIDVDHFKSVNDRFGHGVGDQVLAELGRRLLGTVRTIDLAARAGGEEFVLLLVDTDLPRALITAERVRHAVGAQPVAGLPVTISAGVATANYAEAGDCLMRRADAALYRAKNDGRNRVVGAG